MTIRYISIVFTEEEEEEEEEEEDDDLLYSLEFAFNDDDLILCDFSLFLLLVLDI
jgi:hypothetical protein